MLACTKQHTKIIETLLINKADVFFVNKDGWNCCHIAAREGNPEIVRLLLSSCDPEARKRLCQWKSRNGRKPLHTAGD
jgi:ankyrin repeat protein